MLETRTRVEYRYWVLSLPVMSRMSNGSGNTRLALVMSDSREKIVEFYENEIRRIGGEGYTGDSVLEKFFRPYPSTLSLYIDETWTSNYEAIVRAEVPVKLIEW